MENNLAENSDSHFLFLRGSLKIECLIHKTCKLTHEKLKVLYLGAKKSKYKESTQQNLFKKSKKIKKFKQQNSQIVYIHQPLIE